MSTRQPTSVAAAGAGPACSSRQRMAAASRPLVGRGHRGDRRPGRGPSRSSSTAGGSSSRSRTPARADLRARATRARAAGRRAAGRSRSVPSSPGGSPSVAVAVGDAVTAGQPLLVVEAMKMQNELRAPRDGDGRAASSVGGGGDDRARRPARGPRDDRRRAIRGATAGARRPGRRPSTRRAERRERFATSSGHRGPGPLHPGRPRRRLRRGPRPRAAGRVPVHPRRPADDVPLPLLDDAPVRRLRDGRGDEPALPLPPRAGPDRPVGRLRPADPDGLRLRRARRRRARSAGSASRSLASPTWRSCSTASRSARSAPR